MKIKNKIKYFWFKHHIWLHAPRWIICKLMTKFLDIPFVWMEWRKIEYKTYFGSRPWMSKTHPGLKEVDRDYITNNTARRLTSKKMFIYTSVTNTRAYSKQEVVYISKCRLEEGVEYPFFNGGDGIYSKKLDDARVMRNKEVRDIEPQFYIWCCELNKEKEELVIEGDEYYGNLKDIKNLNKLVNKCIKEYDIFDRVSGAGSGIWDHKPILFKVVEADRIDLAKMLIETCESEEDLQTLLTNKVDDEDWPVDKDRYGKDILSFVKSDEMKELIEKHTTS